MSTALFGPTRVRPRDGVRSSVHSTATQGSRSVSNGRTIKAAQEEATQTWLSDLRMLLSNAEERFADISWTTTADSGPVPGESSASIIWAHKAILYARASNTFHTKFLQLKTPTAQLEQLGGNDSLVSLPLHANPSRFSVDSDARRPSTSRKTVRGAAPPSSFSLNKRTVSGRKSISTSVISRPFRNASSDDTTSLASGFMTSDSENETPSHGSRIAGASASMHSSTRASSSYPRKRPSIPLRKPSFASSDMQSDPFGRSEVSNTQGPLRLEGVSSSFFKSTLEYLYTSKEPFVNDLEFLFQDKLTADANDTPEARLEKLRSDLIFMWRSKLYCDVKLSLGTSGSSDQDAKDSNSIKLYDIPDASVSITSLPHTLDTEFVGDDDEEDEMTTFSAHRMILASRSPYFASLLLSPYADSTAPVLHLSAPPFTAASLHFTLGFLYTGTLFFSNRTFDLSTAFSIWRAGAYLQIATLQSLVSTLIDREFCHGFSCFPPCRKCIKRVPRTLAFSAAPDVSELPLQEAALRAVSGPSFGLYWAKDVGNLEPALQEAIVDNITSRLDCDPALIVSVLRQLTIVGQKIDTERSSHWIECLRSMAETVETRVATLLHANLENIVTSKPWSDLLDGVGSLGDVLEKCLVMLLDGLTEAKAAKTYEVLVGQVLLRDEGFELPNSRQAVENTRASLLRYLKKRWINIRALAGFNQLQKWCLKEIADELEVSTADLLLPDDPKTPTAPKMRSTFRPRSSFAEGGTSSGGVAPTRRTSSTIGIAPNSSPIGSNVTPRASALVASSRLKSSTLAEDGLRTPTAREKSASPSSKPPSSAFVRRVSQHDDAEREAGPIHLRAAVLNRNAARTSVVHGHQPSKAVSSAASASARPPMPKRTSSIDAKSTAVRQPLTSVNHSAAAVCSAVEQTQKEHAGTMPPRTRTNSMQSNSSVGSVNPAFEKGPTSQTQDISTSTNNTQLLHSISRSSVEKAEECLSHEAGERSDDTMLSTSTKNPSSSPAASPSSLHTVGKLAANGTKSDTGSIRSKSSGSSLSGPAKTIRRTPSSLTKSQKSSPSRPDAAAETARSGPLSKSAFLRATPGPGGTFSLSSTDSGRDLRARTISGVQTKSPSPAVLSGSTGPALKPRQSLLKLGAAKRPGPTTPPATKTSSPRSVRNTAPTMMGKGENGSPEQKHVPLSKSASSLRGAGMNRETGPLTAATSMSRSPGTTQDSDLARSHPNGLITPSTSTETMLVHRSPLYRRDVAGSRDRADMAADVSKGDDVFAEHSTGRAPSGITLNQPIPCIVCPQTGPSSRSVSPAVPAKRTPPTLGESLGTRLRGASAQHRFSANVKYIGAVHGCDGLWIGLEVPLPLPAFLDTNDGNAESTLAGSDGSIDGKRYFSLSHHWDAESEVARPPSVLAHAGSRASSASYSGTPNSVPTERAKRRYQYPESEVRRERRRKVYQMATNHLTFSDSEPASPDTLHASTTPTSIGIFVRPRDILLVVGGW